MKAKSLQQGDLLVVINSPSMSREFTIMPLDFLALREVLQAALCCASSRIECFETRFCPLWLAYASVCCF